MDELPKKVIEKSFARAVLRDVQTTDPVHDEAMDKERQYGAQASTLRVTYSDGRRIEGFAWSLYTGYEWADDGVKEQLTLLFGLRAVIVEGYRLRVLLREIDDCRRRHLTELGETEARSALAASEEHAHVITSVHSYPPFKDLLKEIKGEQDEHQTRYPRRA